MKTENVKYPWQNTEALKWCFLTSLLGAEVSWHARNHKTELKSNSISSKKSDLSLFRDFFYSLHCTGEPKFPGVVGTHAVWLSRWIPTPHCQLSCIKSHLMSCGLTAWLLRKVCSMDQPIPKFGGHILPSAKLTHSLSTSETKLKNLVFSMTVLRDRCEEIRGNSGVKMPEYYSVFSWNFPVLLLFRIKFYFILLYQQTNNKSNPTALSLNPLEFYCTTA